ACRGRGVPRPAPAARHRRPPGWRRRAGVADGLRAAPAAARPAPLALGLARVPDAGQRAARRAAGTRVVVDRERDLRVHPEPGDAVAVDDRLHLLDVDRLDVADGLRRLAERDLDRVL